MEARTEWTRKSIQTRKGSEIRCTLYSRKIREASGRKTVRASRIFRPGRKKRKEYTGTGSYKAGRADRSNM
jgi:hypothetical protein